MTWKTRGYCEICFYERRLVSASDRSLGFLCQVWLSNMRLAGVSSSFILFAHVYPPMSTNPWNFSILLARYRIPISVWRNHIIPATIWQGGTRIDGKGRTGAWIDWSAPRPRTLSLRLWLRLPVAPPQDNCIFNSRSLRHHHHGLCYSLSERLRVPSIQKLASSKPRSGYSPRGASDHFIVGL